MLPFFFPPPENFSFTIFSQKSLGFYFFALFTFTYVISYFILKRKKENRPVRGRKAALTFHKVRRIDKRFASASLGGILRVPPKRGCEEMIYIFSQPLIT